MPELYQVVVSAEARKSVRRLPKEVNAAVVVALAALGSEPRAGKSLVGELRGLWSLRRGDYRVLYRINDETKRVEVARIRHRRDVYRHRAP
ncbi:MAG TPA: type II toxin-antitoxin system RelE/ParE family toxin [Candidatus Baltobacterales bacterium]|nr:type II toxin-antitoxin system RelE/ParE family toxin [Candidatus Baltobacterales bacterium]